MNICFVGGGNMATALIGGLLGKGFPAGQISVAEINAENRERLQRDFAVRVSESISEAVSGSQLIVLAVKPQQMRTLAVQLGPLLSGQIVLSIAAGIRLADLGHWLRVPSSNCILVRAMPNTPALVGAGVTGLYAPPGLAQQHINNI